MSTYCITFRIANRTVSGKTYNQRREALVENAQKENLGYWEETTSFLLVESSLDTNAFSKRVRSGLSEADDLLVVFDPSDMSACYFGAIDNLGVLESFFPRLKKSP
ncbi:MAG: hypothetical protein HQ502_04845 [Alphaproteobacteria bacterium]|nr:hypothetical protein [Alphaproteobacteria bacterium]